MQHLDDDRHIDDSQRIDYDNRRTNDDRRDDDENLLNNGFLKKYDRRHKSVILFLVVIVLLQLVSLTVEAVKITYILNAVKDLKIDENFNTTSIINSIHQFQKIDVDKMNNVLTDVQRLQQLMSVEHLATFINTTEKFIFDIKRCTSGFCKM